MVAGAGFEPTTSGLNLYNSAPLGYTAPLYNITIFQRMQPQVKNKQRYTTTTKVLNKC